MSFPSTFSLLHIKKYLTVKSFTKSQIRRKSAVTLDSDNLLLVVEISGFTEASFQQVRAL